MHTLSNKPLFAFIRRDLKVGLSIKLGKGQLEPSLKYKTYVWANSSKPSTQTQPIVIYQVSKLSLGRLSTQTQPIVKYIMLRSQVWVGHN